MTPSRRPPPSGWRSGRRPAARSAVRAALLRGLAVLLTASTATGAAASSWSVLVDGRDRTAAADPLDVAGEVLLDLAGLAVDLGLDVSLGPESVAVVDHRGVRWSGRPGGNVLSAGGETLRLSWVRQTRTGWHVPAPAVATLAGFDLSLDRDASAAVLSSPKAPETLTPALSQREREPEPSTPAAAGGGAGSWEVFTLPKTEGEMAETVRLAGLAERVSGPRELPVLPAARESLRATVGLGFLEGGEWGTEIAAAGLWTDWNVRLSAAAAAGPAGPDVTGHLFLEDPRRAWSVEAGSLYSEAWGYAEGLRVARARDRHRPTLSLYLPATLTRYRDPLVAYRDDVRLGGGVSLAGEAASDGRWSLAGRLRRGWFSGSVYAQAGVDATSSDGASIFLRLGEVGLGGTYNRSEAAGRRVDSHNLQLTLPRAGRLATTLETWGSQTELGRFRAGGATFSLPAGDLRLRLRYLYRTSESGPPGRLLSQDQQEALALVGWAHSRARIDLQLASRWPAGGAASHHADLQAAFALTGRTRLWLLGSFSSVDGAPERYLVRLTRDLPRGFELIAEAGDVVGFPVGRSLLEPGQEPGSYKLLVRHTWDVDTPAGGGAVGGRVLGPGAVPTADVPVRLGKYRVFTDAEGQYLFRKVPEGSYQLSLEETGLPAHLQALTAPMNVEVARGERQDHALFVAPLGHIGGRVFVDRDGDRRMEAREGVGGIVLRLGEEATTSAPDGGFSFHNLPAGRYTVEVVGALLPEELQVAPPSRFEIGLPAGGSLDELDVRLTPRVRPIVFQEM